MINLVSAIIEVAILVKVFDAPLAWPQHGITWLYFIGAVMGAVAMNFMLTFMAGCDVVDGVRDREMPPVQRRIEHPGRKQRVIDGAASPRATLRRRMPAMLWLGHVEWIVESSQGPQQVMDGPHQFDGGAFVH